MSRTLQGFCSYCIIPYARGFVRSKPLNEIRKEAEELLNEARKNAGLPVVDTTVDDSVQTAPINKDIFYSLQDIENINSSINSFLVSWNGTR